MPINIFTGLLVLLCWACFSLLLGYPLYQLLNRRDQAAVPISLAELLFVSLLLGTLIIGPLGLLLLQLGLLTLLRLALGLLLVGGCMTFFHWKLGLHLAPPPVRISTFDVWLGVLLVAGVLLYFHPFEFVLGGGDAGVYVNLGAVWADQGAFWLEEPLLKSLPEEVWSTLFRTASPGAAISYLRMPGFYMDDVSTGTVIPQFFPLHPLWLSLVHALLGLEASLFVTPLWAILGVIALTLALKELFTWKVGVLGGFLLLITPLQIYFARYPTAEALTQLLVWTGAYGLTRFTQKQTPLWGMVFGLALGQVFLTRIDALPLLIVPLLWFLFSLLNKRLRGQGWLFISFGVTLIQAVLQAVLLSFPYTWNIYRSVWAMAQRLLARFWWGLLLVIPLALALVLLRSRGHLHLRGLSCRILRWSSVVIVLGLAILAYFVWPQIGETKMASYWYANSSFPVQNHLNLQKLGWYLSPLGIWLGVGGIAWMIACESLQRIWVLLSIGLLFSVLYIYNIMNNPYHVYAMRRYVPIVVPFFAAGMAYFLYGIWQQSIWGRRGAVVLGLLLSLWLLYNGRAIWTLVEYKGVVAQLERTAEQLEPESILLFEDDVPVGSGSTFGTPLQYVHGFTAFDLQESRVEDEPLMRLIRDWQEEGRSVYWVLGPRVVGALPESLTLEPAFAADFAYERLETSYWHFPTQRFTQRTRLEFYRPLEVGSEVCVSYYDLDVGGFDRWWLGEGFYGDEIVDSRSVRWTDGTAQLDLPCLDVGEDAYITVSVTLGAIVGQPSDSRTVTWIWDGVPQGQTTVTAGEFVDIEFQVPVTVGAGTDSLLGIVSTSWIPAQHGFGADERELGVLIDEIRVSVD